MTPIGGLAVRAPAGTEIRPLARDDLEAALALARTGRGLPPLGPLDEPRRRYEALLADADVVPLAVQADGRPVGLVIVRFRRRLNHATFEGWISDLVVSDEYRGRGIGRALLQAAVAEWQLRRGHRLSTRVPGAAEAWRHLLQGERFDYGLIDLRLVPRELPAGAADGLSIRELGPGDGEAVTRLVAEFGPRRSPVPDRLEAVLRTFRAHAAAVARGAAASRVAELEGMVVGVCTLEWQEPFWTEALHAWVPDLVVTEPMRGRGIGRALLGKAVGLALARGAEELRLETAPQRSVALGLYRSVGFEETGWTAILPRED